MQVGDFAIIDGGDPVVIRSVTQPVGALRRHVLVECSGGEQFLLDEWDLRSVISNG